MNDNGSFWMPPQVSTIAPEVDALFYFILAWSAFFLILVGGLGGYWIWKYRRKNDTPRPPEIRESKSLEIALVLGPTVLVLIVFNWGFRSYVNMSVAPPNSYDVYVTAHQWLWNFEYPTGLNADQLTVPVNQPVQLILTSSDVLHSFSVPAFRVKQDVVPNRYTSLWFEATKTGTYQVFCTEYCGTAHADMLTQVNVVTRDEFDEWIVTGGIDEDMPLAELGAQVYERRQCFACHSLDGTPGVGPTFQGLFGSVREYTDGTTAVMDEDQARRGILRANDQINVGYAAVMPTFEGILQEREVQGLIEFLKTLQ